MSAHNPSQFRRGSRYGLVLGLLIFAFIGFNLVRYLSDRINYEQGHQSFTQAGCALAIHHFDKIINGWRLIEIGDYLALASQEKIECLPFQAAAEKQRAGDFSGAITGYSDFISDYSESILVGAARNRSTYLFRLPNPSTLVNLELCSKLDTLLEQGLIPELDVNLPDFYWACGQIYGTSGNHREGFGMYESLLLEYPNHPGVGEAEASLLVNPVSCEKIDSLKSSSIANRAEFIPTLYYNCGEMFEASQDRNRAFVMYQSLLLDYPSHSRAGEAEAKLLANPVSCEKRDSLKASSIANRTEFIPTLYYNCGGAFEASQDWNNAVSMYETFLAEYPGHFLAPEIKVALARSIVERAKEAGAGEIPAPERSGSTGNQLTNVTIQNVSPERLRIVFSGEESRVEELGACSSCSTYTGLGPLFCPEAGPIGSYTLTPGQYDVVVESISDAGVTPWSGSWSLNSGDEYYTCFVIVITTSP